MNLFYAFFLRAKHWQIFLVLVGVLTSRHSLNTSWSVNSHCSDWTISAFCYLES